MSVSDERRRAMETGAEISPPGSSSVNDEEVSVDEPVIESFPLPAHVTETEEGDWIYEIQYPWNPIGNKAIPLPQKVRIPKCVYARDVRAASRGENEGEALYFLCCSLVRLPVELMDRMDARDYAVVQVLCLRRTRGKN